jgi:hypothetical protein
LGGGRSAVRILYNTGRAGGGGNAVRKQYCTAPPPLKWGKVFLPHCSPPPPSYDSKLLITKLVRNQQKTVRDIKERSGA